MRLNILICLLLAGVTLGSYHTVGKLGFLDYDDPDYIINNSMVNGGITIENCWLAFSQSHDGNWHPVTWLSHMLDCQIFGLKPMGHHWVNVGLHIVNTLLLFIVLRKMTGSVWRSTAVAALFALHPLHIQSVAWVSERKDLLSGLFMLLMLWAYVHHVQRQKIKKNGADSRFLLMAFVCFALGLLSKPMLVTLPAILLLLDFWPLNRFTHPLTDKQTSNWFQSPIFKGLLLEKIPFAILSLISTKVTLWAQSTVGFVIKSETLPFLERIANVPVFYVAYLQKTFWPENLAIFYPYQQILLWEQSCAFLLLVLLTAVCIRLVQTRPYWIVGWFWYLIMLLPVIGLVQVGGQSIADRYTYLPSIGLFIIVAWVIGELAIISSRWLVCMSIGAIILVLACAVSTLDQLKYWQNSITLFRRSLDVTKENNSLSYFALGYALWHAGDLDGAAKNYYAGLQAGSKYQWALSPVAAHHNLGCVLLLQEKPADAEVQFKAALQFDPKNAFAHKYLGDALSDQGKDAEAEYSIAAQLAPGNTGLLQQIEASKTLVRCLETLKTQSTPELCAQIASIRAGQGKFQTAVKFYLAALKLDPNSPEILNNLAWLLAACPDKKVRDGDQAVKFAKHACDITNWEKTIYIGTLAAAYAEAGNFDNAIITAQRACDLAAQNGENDLLMRNQQLMQIYRIHQPVHE